MALYVMVGFLQGAKGVKYPDPLMDLLTDPEEHQPADSMILSDTVY